MKVVHNLLADTAKAIAKEAYESMAHDNAFYAEWPTIGSYVHANWTLHLPEVRAQFVKILAGETHKAGLAMIQAEHAQSIAPEPETADA